MIYLSTTFLGKKNSFLNDVLENIDENDYNIDGIEFGSTHKFEKKINNIIKNYNFKNKKILVHNFFPPIPDANFVLNISSSEKKIRDRSIKIIKKNILFAKSLNAKYYTIHPGFRSESRPNLQKNNSNYDFNFNNKICSYNSTFKNLISSLNKIIDFSKKNKLKVLLETEGSIHKYKYLILQQPHEFYNLIDIYGNDINFNFNLSHSLLASKVFNFNIIKFINNINNRIKLVEISHNNKIDDLHKSLRKNSYILKYLKYIECKDYILEFRNTNSKNIHKSINILKQYI